MRRALVLLNRNAGTGAGHEPRGLAAVFARAGIEADVEEMPGDRLLDAAKLAARAPGVDVVVAAGGDGTVSAVANGLAGSRKPMGILPLGTLNHFAKDLGVPLDVEGAVRAIASGRDALVDVAEVNGRVFLNNSSIGLYPEIVLARERIRERHGVGKWLAMLVALVRALARFRRMLVLVDLRDRMLPRRTTFVFVGNNRYDPRGAPGAALRPSLQEGELAVYTAHSATRRSLVRLAARALVGPLEGARGVDVAARRELVVRAPTTSLIRVALDGEVAWLETPLRYRSRPGALRVRVPGGGASA